MNTKRPDVAEIYAEAPDNPAQLEAYLAEACGRDDALRARVKQLLEARAHRGSFLDSQAMDRTSLYDRQAENTLGSTIGPYKLLEEIGEGGMGVVYLAEQTKPVRRRVALKVIKPGMDTRQVVARFNAERQALALMDHANVCRVIDAGATEAGRPYFVMDLVRGLAITDYCDRERHTIRQRLELFVLVCRAVQHAHQKGVIHRDIKPSNILVTVIDGVAIPKIIDFGVAKATGPTLVEGSLLTGFHQFIGTPLYMSPEQADLSGVDVDTRSDIYSLGVLLYELLTGTTPILQETFRAAGPESLRKLICETETPPPSSRLSTLCDQLRSTASTNRQAEPRPLSLSMRGEVDWIVMKALDKDRQRRYESAAALADDVLRHLNDEPVEACPPSRRYHMGKFVRRHRSALSIGAFIFGAILFIAGFSALQAMRATRAERQTAAALEESQQRLELAQRAVNEMYSEVATKWLSRDGKLHPLQRTFLEKALAFYEEFARENPEDAPARFHIALTNARIATIQERLGQGAEAEATLKEAITKFEEVLPNLKDETDCRRELARTLFNLGELHWMHNRFTEAEETLLRSHKLLKTVLEVRPMEMTSRDLFGRTTMAIGNVRRDRDDHKGAATAYREARDNFRQLLAEFPDSRHILRMLAYAEVAVAKEEDSVESLRKGISLLEQLIAHDPQDPAPRYNLAVALNDLSGMVSDEESREVYRRNIEHCQQLVDDFPDSPHSQYLLATMSMHYGTKLRELKQYEEAEPVLRSAVELAARASSISEDPDTHNAHASACFRLSNLLFQIDRVSEAESHAAKAIEISKQVQKNNPERGYYRRDLGDILKYLAVNRYRVGDWKGAIEAANQSIELGNGRDEPLHYLVLALSHARLGDKEAAEAWHAKSAQLIAKGPPDPDDEWLFEEVAAVFESASAETKPDE